MSSSTRKAKKMLEREQRKRSQRMENKFKKPENQSTNQLLGIKSIAEMQKKGIGENIGDQLKLAWYFEKWYEKIILVVLCALGMWKIVGFF